MQTFHGFRPSVSPCQISPMITKEDNTYFLIKNVLVCLSVAVFTQAFLVAASGSSSSWWSPALGRRPRSCGSRALEHTSAAVAHGLACSMAHGVFLDQGSNPCPLHWQAEILNHCTSREVPILIFLTKASWPLVSNFLTLQGIFVMPTSPYLKIPNALWHGHCFCK